MFRSIRMRKNGIVSCTENPMSYQVKQASTNQVSSDLQSTTQSNEGSFRSTCNGFKMCPKIDFLTQKSSLEYCCFRCVNSTYPFLALLKRLPSSSPKAKRLIVSDSVLS